MNDNRAPIYLTRDGDIAEMVLNRPHKHNALNQAVWRAIPDLVRQVEEDQAVKVLIIRGVGEEAFASGADISEFEEVHATAEIAHAYHEEIERAFSAVAEMAKPTIAMIHGLCFGGGCALALCCDLRYADTTARFCIPPARLGIAYSLKESKRLADVVGLTKAKEMLMGARIIEAEEARAIGLATQLFEPKDLQKETKAFAQTMSELSQYTVRASKQVLNEIADGAVDETDLSRRLAAEAFDGPDYEEGRAAFLEKRKPDFTYR